MSKVISRDNIWHKTLHVNLWESNWVSEEGTTARLVLSNDALIKHGTKNRGRLNLEHPYQEAFDILSKSGEKFKSEIDFVLMGTSIKINKKRSN